MTDASAAISAHIAALNAQHGIAGAVSFRWDARGGIVADLAAAGSRAVVSLFGGQVLSWRPAGGREALWLSAATKLGTSKAVRGGIPVCWPWFGPHPAEAGLPAHGFVRTAEWFVGATSAGESGAGEKGAVNDGVTSLTLSYATGAPGGIWPHQADVALTVACGAVLDVALVTINTGAAPIWLTQALHTYLAVADIGAVAISGLDDRDFIDQASGIVCAREGRPLRFPGEIDRLYRETNEDVVVRDGASGRTQRVAKRGSLSTIVWNPGSGKAARLGDCVDAAGTDGWRRFVCVEAANAGADAIELAPGRRHELATVISID